MTTTEAIKTIFEEAKRKMHMKDSQAYEYIGEVVSFHVGRLNFEQDFTPENMEKALIEEAELHLCAKEQGVA